MADIHLRPRFNRSFRCRTDDLFERLQQSLDGQSAVRGSVFTNSCVLKVPENEVHFWSPQLHLSIESEDDDSAVVHGLYGPRPSVWSIFVALYVAIAFIGSMGLIYGLSKMSIGEASTALWFGPGCIGAASAVYIIGRIGRRLGMEQMIELRDFFNTAVEDCAEKPDTRIELHNEVS